MESHFIDPPADLSELFHDVTEDVIFQCILQGSHWVIQRSDLTTWWKWLLPEGEESLGSRLVDSIVTDLHEAVKWQMGHTNLALECAAFDANNRRLPGVEHALVRGHPYGDVASTVVRLQLRVVRREKDLICIAPRTEDVQLLHELFLDLELGELVTFQWRERYVEVDRLIGRRRCYVPLRPEDDDDYALVLHDIVQILHLVIVEALHTRGLTFSVEAMSTKGYTLNVLEHAILEAQPLTTVPKVQFILLTVIPIP